MQTQMNSDQLNSKADEGFHQMADGMKNALNEFEANAPEEGYAQYLLNAVKPVADYSQAAWNSSFNFVRRYPVQTAVGVVAIGFLASRFLMSKPAPRAADGRQY